MMKRKGGTTMGKMVEEKKKKKKGRPSLLDLQKRNLKEQQQQQEQQQKFLNQTPNPNFTNSNSNNRSTRRNPINEAPDYEQETDEFLLRLPLNQSHPPPPPYLNSGVGVGDYIFYETETTPLLKRRKINVVVVTGDGSGGLLYVDHHHNEKLYIQVGNAVAVRLLQLWDMPWGIASQGKCDDYPLFMLPPHFPNCSSASIEAAE